MKTTSARISPERYPIAATATAPVYDFEEGRPSSNIEERLHSGLEQQALFEPPPDPRVIPFESWNPGTKRDSTRTWNNDRSRLAPIASGKVEVSPRKIRSASTRRRSKVEQQRLDFFGQPEILTQPQSTIICDAPVAPNALRLHAALVDGVIILAGCVLAALIFRFAGGSLTMAKNALLFAAVSLATIPFFYKLLWAFANLDSIGMHAAGLRLVDFDGNSPTRERRYHRIFGSLISVLAAGMGLVWAFVDQDSLTWHDHISGTFPTIT